VKHTAAHHTFRNTLGWRTCGSSCGQEKRSQLMLYTTEAGSSGGPPSSCGGANSGAAAAAAAVAESRLCCANGDAAPPRPTPSPGPSRAGRPAMRVGHVCLVSFQRRPRGLDSL